MGRRLLGSVSEEEGAGTGRKKPIKQQRMRSDWRTQPIRGRDEGVDGPARLGLVPWPVVQWLKQRVTRPTEGLRVRFSARGHTNLGCWFDTLREATNLYLPSTLSKTMRGKYPRVRSDKKGKKKRVKPARERGFGGVRLQRIPVSEIQDS